MKNQVIFFPYICIYTPEKLPFGPFPGDGSSTSRGIAASAAEKIQTKHSKCIFLYYLP